MAHPPLHVHPADLADVHRSSDRYNPGKMRDLSDQDRTWPDAANAWTDKTTPVEAFRRGLRLAVTTPGIVLFLSAIGFGTLVRDAGMQLGHVLFLSTVLYALPAQVMVVDQLHRCAAILAIAFAVSLTAVRLLPMTVSLLPYLRSGRSSIPVQLLAVHAIAVTAWIEGSRRLPGVPEALRMPHFLGLGLGMMVATSAGGSVGFLLAARVPPLAQTALLFMTPIYFLLSTLSSASDRRDWFAIVLGGLIGPAVYVVAPSLDLVVAGLVGGSIAYLASRRPA